MREEIKIDTVGDSAVKVEYAGEVSIELSEKVQKLAYSIEKHNHPDITDIVPAYRSLTVYFDPLKSQHDEIVTLLERKINKVRHMKIPPARVFRLPTVFGDKYGPDLGRVSEKRRLSPNEIVRVFSSQSYLVYFTGFICSLPYLGNVSEKLETPRLDSPRLNVPMGSVGIAGKQVVLLTADMPSGFNYIGQTFVKTYDPNGFPPIELRAGDRIYFQAVNERKARKYHGKGLLNFV